MKLTISQIHLLQEAIRTLPGRYEDNAALTAEMPETSAYWKQEATEARELMTLLNDVIHITVETASLKPAVPDFIAEHGKADVSTLRKAARD